MSNRYLIFGGEKYEEKGGIRDFLEETSNFNSHEAISQYVLETYSKRDDIEWLQVVLLNTYPISLVFDWSKE